MNNLNREMILSAAVKPNIEIAKQLYFQEWDLWLSGGLVDWVLVMNYEPLYQTFVDNITAIENQISKSEFNKIIILNQIIKIE